LNANDPDTQQYFANLIGTRIFRKYSMSEFQNESREPTGYSSLVSESRELLIQLYEFATLKKAVVLTPYGACLLEKFYINSEMANEQLLPAFGTHPARPSVDMDPSLKFISSESGSRMLTAAERTENARRHAREALNHPEEDGQETKQAVEREAFIQSIAGSVLQRFPQLWDLEAGFQAEDADWYRPLEYILKRLADNQALLDEMKREAGWPPSSGTKLYNFILPYLGGCFNPLPSNFQNEETFTMYNTKKRRYEHKITLGTDTNGNTVRKSFYSTKSKADARKKAEAFKVQYEMEKCLCGEDKMKATKFAGWAIHCLKIYKKPYVKANTYTSTYLAPVETHLIPRRKPSRRIATSCV